MGHWPEQCYKCCKLPEDQESLPIMWVDDCKNCVVKLRQVKRDKEIIKAMIEYSEKLDW